jgi:Tol biopolymer transport system component
MHTSGDIHGGRRRPHHHLHRRRLIATVLTAALGLSSALAGLALAPGAPAAAATTTAVSARVSVTSTGGQVVAGTQSRTVTDDEGRFVAFGGGGAYDPADTNGTDDVYVRDRLAGTTTRVSLTDDDEQIDGSAALCGASADLRHIGFWSNASDLPGGATGQIYVRDRVAGTTSLVSIGAGGLPSTKPGGTSGVGTGRCDISSDGRYVVFTSEGTNLVADGNGVADVFRRDRVAGTTVRISVKDDESEITGYGSTDPQMSDDGSIVVFTTRSIVSLGDANDATDVFVRHVAQGSTSPISTTTASTYPPSGASSEGAISGDGTTVAFVSQATALVPGGADDNGPTADVFVRTFGGARERVSVSSTEQEGDDASSSPTVSSDGRFVAFSSVAENLWPLDGNDGRDAFLRDRQLGLTTLASRRVTTGAPSATHTPGPPAVSGDGTAVAFVSVAPDIVRGDTNGTSDVFVRDTDIDHAPFGSFDTLVAQQFADFAGRAPTTTEATTWRDRLVNGEVSPDEVIADMAHSNAWSGRRGPVTRLYWSFFLRAPDLGGLDYWVAQNAAGKGLHPIAGQFAQAKEFKDTYGALSNSAFVTLIYQNVLERDPDPAGLHYWNGQLTSGAITRGSLMVGFSESAEGRRFLAPPVDAVLVHLGMLRVMPTKAVFLAATASLEDGLPLEALVSQLRYAQAYVARVT